MVILMLQDAVVCGDLWKAGTRVSVPDLAATKAIAQGVATVATEAPAADPPPAKSVSVKRK